MDATTVELQYNKGTDGSPDFSGTAVGLSGSNGANEIRWCGAGAGANNTPSASWPGYARPLTVQGIPECWCYPSDASGTKVATYDGTNAHANVFRWHVSSELTAISQPLCSFFANASLPTPSPGTQPASPASDGAGLVNGHAVDTNDKSYLKMAFYGPGIDAAGVQYTPSAGAIGTMPVGSTGTTGAVTTAQTGVWSSWQDAQGFLDYVQGGSTWKALTALYWYFSLICLSGPNLCLGPDIGATALLQYSYT